jgi:hypothetical protein
LSVSQNTPVRRSSTTRKGPSHVGESLFIPDCRIAYPASPPGVCPAVDL